MEVPHSVSAFARAISFELTKMHNLEGLLTKEFVLADGEIIKIPHGVLFNGMGETIAFHSLSELNEVLGGFQPEEAITLGTCPAAKNGPIHIVTKANENVDAGDYARSKENFQLANGVQLVLLDYDYDASAPYTIDSPEMFRNKLIEAIPAFAEIGMLILGSASAGVRLAGTPETELTGGGLHCYILISSGNDMDKLKEILRIRLWQAGLGYIKVSESGALLERCLVDLAVFSPERLIYEAPPVLGAGLEKSPRQSQLFDGGVLDVAALKAPTDAELLQVEDLIACAKDAAAEQAGIVRRSYLKSAESKRVKRGVPVPVARRMTMRLEVGDLAPGDTIVIWGQR